MLRARIAKSLSMLAWSDLTDEEKRTVESLDPDQSCPTHVYARWLERLENRIPEQLRSASRSAAYGFKEEIRRAGATDPAGAVTRAGILYGQGGEERSRRPPFRVISENKEAVRLEMGTAHACLVDEGLLEGIARCFSSFDARAAQPACRKKGDPACIIDVRFSVP